LAEESIPFVIETRITLGGSTYRAHWGAAIDLALPVNFEKQNPSFFDLPQPRITAVEGGGFIGDTQRGGSCNCSTIELTPHGSMTHTESAAHLDAKEAYVADVAPKGPLPCQLITVLTQPFRETNESYNGFEHDEDLVISAQTIKEQWSEVEGIQALVIRSLPDEGKAMRNYGERPAAYLTHEAVELIVKRGIDHLVLDLPSLDRYEDGGSLPNHRIFWQLKPGSRAHGGHRTVTELALVPNEAQDGVYLLDLQVPRMLCDAAPSRPLLFPLERAP
tara:strand:- start:599 stop:1426 length:828 start_codon:yes stop_codon:yes gene_type:complete